MEKVGFLEFGNEEARRKGLSFLLAQQVHVFPSARSELAALVARGWNCNTLQ